MNATNSLPIYRVWARHEIAGACEPMNVRAYGEGDAREEYLARCVQPSRMIIMNIEIAPKGSRPTRSRRIDR